MKTVLSSVSRSFTLVVVCSLLFIGVFVFMTSSAYAAPAHTAVSLHVGGGCATQIHGKYSIGACIGTSNGLSDGYINNGACATKVIIFNTDVTSSSTFTSASVTGTCITGHVPGKVRPGMISGHQYKTFVNAYFGTTADYTTISPPLTW